MAIRDSSGRLWSARETDAFAAILAERGRMEELKRRMRDESLPIEDRREAFRAFNRALRGDEESA